MNIYNLFYQVIMPIITIVSGGGWFVTYKAYKRKNDGLATQSEAEGWAKMQEVYQRTIADLKTSCEYIRSDRDLLRQENEKLREENNSLRSKILDFEKQITELRKEIARQGRQIESLNSKTKKKEQPQQ